MPILSFGWTAHLLPPNGCKDTTRRQWSERTLKAWQKAWDENPNKLHKAYDKCSFVKGAKQIGWITLKERPFLEPLRKLTPVEITREGHPELTWLEFIEKYFWKPNKNWDDDTLNLEWCKLLKTEFVVVRFDYQSLAIATPPEPKQLSLI